MNINFKSTFDQIIGQKKSELDGQKIRKIQFGQKKCTWEI